jgi:hypothetical protein
LLEDVEGLHSELASWGKDEDDLRRLLKEKVNFDPSLKSGKRRTGTFFGGRRWLGADVEHGGKTEGDGLAAASLGDGAGRKG